MCTLCSFLQIQTLFINISRSLATDYSILIHELVTNFDFLWFVCWADGIQRVYQLFSSSAQASFAFISASNICPWMENHLFYSSYLTQLNCLIKQIYCESRTPVDWNQYDM